MRPTVATVEAATKQLQLALLIDGALWMERGRYWINSKTGSIGSTSE
jgi:hypothetical protein